MSYINRLGGTRSSILALHTKELWEWCLQRGITLSAEYLPGSLNVIADRESRTVQSTGEWMLDPAMFQALDNNLGPLKVDMFATRLNNQTTLYFSWKPDPFALATDALQTPWTGLQGGYAFPPFSLIGRCLQKVKRDKSTIVLLAPVWPTQYWFPTLLESLVEAPLLLQSYRTLLKGPFGEPNPLLLHSPPLQLAVWRVSGDVTRQKGFRQKLQTLSQWAGAQVLTQCISPPGGSGVAGVVENTLIPFQGVLTP